MGGVKNALTRKIGPFPAWVWAGVAGVALYFYRKSQGSSAAASTNPAGTLGYYGPYGQDPYSGGSGGAAPGDSSTGAGTGAGTTGGGGGSPSGSSGTDPGTAPATNGSTAPLPTTPVTPATTATAVVPAAKVAKPKAQHAKPSLGSGIKAQTKKIKANPRSKATFSGGPVTRAHPKHATPPKPPPRQRTTNPSRITRVSTNRRRPAPRR
jgi:hypothetical protein